jgi:hypothetical protein
MSGIFKGDSIYKSGGGGGGYKDGGQLVDGDFIKVENNTISYYDNVSRNDVNFYFDDDKNIDAIINFTTLTNTTLHIYKEQNGVLIPLNYEGINTAEPGKKYLIHVSLNLFRIEEITESTDDEYFNAGVFGFVPIKQIGTRMWFCKDLFFGVREDIPDLGGGWHVPNTNDIDDLKNAVSNDFRALMSTSGWTGTQGTNTSHFNAKPFGYYDIDSATYDQVGTAFFMFIALNGIHGGFTIWNVGSGGMDYSGVGGIYQPRVKMSVRLCKGP